MSVRLGCSLVFICFLYCLLNLSVALALFRSTVSLHHCGAPVRGAPKDAERHGLYCFQASIRWRYNLQVTFQDASQLVQHFSNNKDVSCSGSFGDYSLLQSLYKKGGIKSEFAGMTTDQL
ncbi:hypothetical protein BT69DRAFT_215475 [Atractiella rhizophila]|nr:hypothetical protein BT69DRAFT_215475 [Atractiella rhizophila]